MVTATMKAWSRYNHERVGGKKTENCVYVWRVWVGRFVKNGFQMMWFDE